MAKIIMIQDGIVSIGTDAGGIEEVRLCDLNFNPAVGDEVEIYKTETRTIVALKEPERQNNYSDTSCNDGKINININNENINTNVNPQSNSNGNRKAVNKVAYCLLAFFLGSFGVQKFYAGYVGKGILCLCFCWSAVPGIVGIIECIICLFKRADEHGNILV